MGAVMNHDVLPEFSVSGFFGIGEVLRVSLSLPVGFLVVLETTPDADMPSASSIFFLFRHLLSLFVRPKVSWQARQKYEGGQKFGKFTRFPPRPGFVV